MPDLEYALTIFAVRRMAARINGEDIEPLARLPNTSEIHTERKPVYSLRGVFRQYSLNLPYSRRA